MRSIEAALAMLPVQPSLFATVVATVVAVVTVVIAAPTSPTVRRPDD